MTHRHLLLYNHTEEDAVTSAQLLIFGATVTKSRVRQWLHLCNNSVVMDAKMQEGHLLPKLLDVSRLARTSNEMYTERSCAGLNAESGGRAYRCLKPKTLPQARVNICTHRPVCVITARFERAKEGGVKKRNVKRTFCGSLVPCGSASATGSDRL